MKIAFVLDDRLDKPDGVQQCVRILGTWLSRHGHDVHYIVGETKDKDLPNIHVAARNLPVSFNGNRLSIPLPASGRHIRALLREMKPDILHVQAPYSPFMGAKVIRSAGANTGVVGTFHVLPYGWLARWGTKLLGVWLKPSLKRFAAMYAGSPAAAAFCEWSFGTKTAVIPHPIEVATFRAAKLNKRPAGKLRLVFLGRLVPRKGARELILAIAALPAETRERIEVRIGGRGPLLQELQKLVAAKGMGELIKFDGFVAEADKAAYLARADIAVFPSISGESFGISLVEPLAAGAGVVMGGDNPGYASILGEWPVTLVNPRDTADFSAKLQRLVMDEGLRHDLHDKQQATVPLYDIETTGRRWVEIYTAALDGRRK